MTYGSHQLLVTQAEKGPRLGRNDEKIIERFGHVEAG